MVYESRAPPLFATKPHQLGVSEGATERNCGAEDYAYSGKRAGGNVNALRAQERCWPPSSAIICPVIEGVARMKRTAAAISPSVGPRPSNVD